MHEQERTQHSLTATFAEIVYLLGYLGKEAGKQQTSEY